MQVWENGTICTTTEIYFLPVGESYIHALPKYLTTDGTYGILPMLFNHEDAFLGPEGH